MMSYLRKVLCHNPCGVEGAGIDPALGCQLAAHQENGDSFVKCWRALEVLVMVSEVITL